MRFITFTPHHSNDKTRCNPTREEFIDYVEIESEHEKVMAKSIAAAATTT